MRTSVLARWALSAGICLGFCLPAHAEEPAAGAPEAQDDGARSSGLFTRGSIGAGVFMRTGVGDADELRHRFCLSLENKTGVRLGSRFSIFLLSHVAINDTETGGDFAKWVYKKDDYLLFKAIFLTAFIPMAFLLDSQALVAPGISFHLSDRAPSLFFDLGGGLSSVQSAANGESYVFGFGMFAGVGVEITRKIGLTLRVVWAPSFTQSEWTQTDGHAISLVGMLSLL